MILCDSQRFFRVPNFRWSTDFGFFSVVYFWENSYTFRILPCFLRRQISWSKFDKIRVSVERVNSLF
jgi:hypothetical protein